MLRGVARESRQRSITTQHWIIGNLKCHGCKPVGIYYGEIPDLQGVFANEADLKACRDQLQDVLEGWIILVHRGENNKTFAGQ